MKRDMDLAREILLEIEQYPEGNGLVSIKLDGYTQKEISYHIKLLVQASLIEGKDVSSMGEDGFGWLAGSLTWEGHEFLEAARDKSRWDKTKKLITDKGGGLVFDVLKQVLIQGAKTAIGL